MYGIQTASNRDTQKVLKKYLVYIFLIIFHNFHPNSKEILKVLSLRTYIPTCSVFYIYNISYTVVF